MAGVGDAVRYGLVASLAHPSGNVTGITLITQDVTAKALELLKEFLPQRQTHRVSLERGIAVQRRDPG